MKIAVNLPPEPGLPWTLMRQCGIDHAVCPKGLQTTPNAPEDEQPWSLKGLRGWQETYENIGVELAVIEGRPGMEKIKLALPGRDEEIDVVCRMLRNMGELGIPVWCSSWMPILGVMRTRRDLPTRGGALVSAFHHEQIHDEPVTKHGVVTEEEQWENLRYFLERVVPTAEEAGVKMAMHPDDPPLSPIRGVARIMSSVENYQRLIDLVPSPMNGIGLCQGNFALMTDDLPGVIRDFGRQERIHFVTCEMSVARPSTSRRPSTTTARRTWLSAGAHTGMWATRVSAAPTTTRGWETTPTATTCGSLGSSPSAI